MSKAVMQQALDALTRGYADAYLDQPAIEALRQELAKSESEPRAWLVTDCIGERFLCFDKPTYEPLPDRVTALYTKD